MSNEAAPAPANTIPFYRSGAKEYPKANIFSPCCGDMLHRPKRETRWYCFECGATYVDALPLVEVTR